MFPLYQVYYFEEFVNRPPRDIRAIVIGDKVAAASIPTLGQVVEDQ